MLIRPEKHNHKEQMKIHGGEKRSVYHFQSKTGESPSLLLDSPKLQVQKM